jgi:lysozyme
MITSALGYSLIRREEGLSLFVKGDTGGKQEIGYGHDLLPGESYPDGISQDYAQTLLQQDVAKAESHLNPLIPAGCTQNQFDALIDFTYECGAGAAQQLLAHGWSQVTLQLPRWVHAQVNGQTVTLPGMVNRRAAEIALFSTPGPIST